MTTGINPSTLAARALIDSLITHGVEHVVLCPGSRSAPLAYALAGAARAGRLEVHVRVDERVAAFTALGLARFGPAAVVTTSGTAAANLHPALLEARHAGLGLIAVTADRPHEMRGVGANQTTDQLHMFGPRILSVELPAGAGAAAIANQVARLAARARGVFGPREPVHLNVAFRDPLVPGDAPAHVPAADGPEPPEALRATVEPIAVPADARGVVVAGDGAGPTAAEFAARAGWPLLAEPSSGARGGTTAIGPYQLLIPDLARDVERVVVFGRPTLSRPVSGLLATAPHVTVVAAGPEWVDVTGNAKLIAGAVSPAGRADAAWLERWRESERATGGGATLAAAVLSHVLGSGAPQLMIGSSLPIRYADIHGPAGASFTSEAVWSARGLAGIDGTISTATGIALASGPIRVVLGDLTFAHDVGGLALGPRERAADIQIVVLNDGGGGIFGGLEHGDPAYSDVFERFFATPLELDLEHIATAYGYRYRKIDSPAEIPSALAPRISGRSIVEVELPRVSGNSQETFRGVSMRFQDGDVE